MIKKHSTIDTKWASSILEKLRTTNLHYHSCDFKDDEIQFCCRMKAKSTWDVLLKTKTIGYLYRDKLIVTNRKCDQTLKMKSLKSALNYGLKLIMKQYNPDVSSRYQQTPIDIKTKQCLT